MKSILYSVFDAKTAVFGFPFVAMRDEAAIRAFSDSVNDVSNPNNNWNRHPEDFSLFRVGLMDDETGVLVPQPPVSLVTASALFAVRQWDPSHNGSKKSEMVS